MTPKELLRASRYKAYQKALYIAHQAEGTAQKASALNELNRVLQEVIGIMKERDKEV